VFLQKKRSESLKSIERLVKKNYEHFYNAVGQKVPLTVLVLKFEGETGKERNLLMFEVNMSPAISMKRYRRELCNGMFIHRDIFQKTKLRFPLFYLHTLGAIHKPRNA